MSNKTILHTGLCAVPLAALVACGGGGDVGGTATEMAAGKPTTGSSTTAQGIWVDLQGAADLSIQQTEIYGYQPTLAAALVTNTQTSGPVVVCEGKGCSIQPVPTTPDAPPPDATKVQDFITAGGNSSFKCSLLDGSMVSGTTYTQSVNLPPIGSGNTKAVYSYTWTYAVAPTQTSYDRRTAWTLQATTGDGTAPVEIGGDVAGQSVLVKSGVSKYSFSLGDDAGANRVANLNVAVLAGGNVLSSSATTSTVVSNAPGAMPGAPGAVDFLYETHNGGTNGDTSLLKTGMQARAILNGDGFSGNDNGGSDGKALAKAVITPVTFQLGEGDYLIQLTGTVKGNNASATSTSFNIQKTLHIVGTSCGSTTP